MMVLVVEPQYNYMLCDNVMTFLYALHALPLAFHALSSIVVEVETPCTTFYDFNNPLLNFKLRERERFSKDGLSRTMMVGTCCGTALQL
jgi:hypothetical protein